MQIEVVIFGGNHERAASNVSMIAGRWSHRLKVGGAPVLHGSSALYCWDCDALNCLEMWHLVLHGNSAV
jgi:hypothetical protein